MIKELLIELVELIVQLWIYAWSAALLLAIPLIAFIIIYGLIMIPIDKYKEWIDSIES